MQLMVFGGHIHIKAEDSYILISKPAIVIKTVRYRHKEQSTKSNKHPGEYGVVCGDSQVMTGTQCGDCHHGNHIGPRHVSTSKGRPFCPFQIPNFGKTERDIPRKKMKTSVSSEEIPDYSSTFVLFR
ncbi:hypothetical protein STEG23_006506, partial [Scotinomys teguina]